MRMVGPGIGRMLLGVDVAKIGFLIEAESLCSLGVFVRAIHGIAYEFVLVVTMCRVLTSTQG